MTIAWYVHHHGSGHTSRALAITRYLNHPVVALSSGVQPEGWGHNWEVLPGDSEGVVPEVDDVTAHGTLHWAPLRHGGYAERMHRIAAVLSTTGAELLVCDVSVEVAALARLLGVSVVLMAQPGNRLDRAHRLAYDLADHLVAPWPAWVGGAWPDEWVAKTSFVGAVSRFSGRRPPPLCSDRRPKVLVLWGRGGQPLGHQELIAAADATPHWDWDVAGFGAPETTERPSNLRWAGWRSDPWPGLCAADVVVSHAGQNAVAEIADVRRPAILIPQPRPHDEQVATGQAIEQAGLARVLPQWPPADQWPDILAEAQLRGGEGWLRWTVGGGPTAAAREIGSLAMAGRR